MLAVDTNVVVRYLAEDDAEQSARARAFFELSGTAFVASTVLLETEWVLRVVYKTPVPRVIALLRAVCGLQNVRLEHPERIRFALDAAARGLDFADALHLAAAADCTAFVTFDRDLRRAAEALGGTPVREP